MKRKMKQTLHWCVSMTAVLAVAVTAQATTWNVPANGVLQTVIDNAAAGDTILVAAGTYPPISTTNKTITIQSVSGAEHTIIEGGGTSRCATLGTGKAQRQTVLTGFTLRKGYFNGNGGGVIGGTLNNCILKENEAKNWGGGAFGSTLNNCLLWKNVAGNGGGGADQGELRNCTVVYNIANEAGGGVRSSDVYNSIVWNNTNKGNYWGGMDYNAHNHFGTSFKNSNTKKLPSGTGNIEVEPFFVDAANGNFRLEDYSCYAGNSAYVVGEFDLDGNPLLYNGMPTMGAYAYFPYTVTLEGNGGSGGMASINVRYDFKMPWASAPTRIGYTFQGYWDTNTTSGGTQYYTAAMMSVRNWDKTQNTTLYARWEANVHTVSLHSNGDSGNVSIKATYDSPMPWTNAPTRVGYTFQGYWYNEKQYYTATMESARNWDNAFWSGRGNEYLSARWTANTYTVTLNPNGGSDGTISVTATYALAMPLANAPTWNGFKFQGYWDTNAASGGTQYYTAAMVSARNWDKANDTTLYARWEIAYTVTLDPNGGSGETNSVIVTYGSAMPPTNAPSARIGYTFQGYWDTNATSGGTQYYTAAMTSARTWNKTTNTTLYARWAGNLYAVALNPNGGGSDGTPSINVIYGSGMPSATAPTRSEYLFQGFWDTSATSGGTQYYTATMVSVRNWDKANNTTLYARWTAKATTIPGNPDVSANFLDGVTQSQIDALVLALTNTMPEITAQEIALKFENADLFGFSALDLVLVGNDALMRLEPAIRIGDIRLAGTLALQVTFTIANGIDAVPADALARVQSVITERVKGRFCTDLLNATPTELVPSFSQDAQTGIVTAMFAVDTSINPIGVLQLRMKKF